MPPASPYQRTNPAASDLWEKVLSSLRDEINPQLFKTWLDPLRPLDLDDQRLVLGAPNAFLRDWIEENYLSAILRALESLAGRSLSVHFHVAENEPAYVPPPEEQKALPAPNHRPAMPSASLNPRYTFESFVVGASNQFAHAAAMAVAEQPGRSYNPLFLYGGTGLGKTHLMHAIGNFILKAVPSSRVSYVSSEKFTNDLISSLRFDRMPQFREMYRNMDVILVDDIHFIAGKERTQEEFFHTFNNLFDAHRQIVVSSDKYPREIPDLEERLRSRFEWGLVADLQPPDLETKVAILEKKAQQSGIDLPKEVSLFLAQNTASNIRELEGYLLRIVAFAAIKKSGTINMDLVKEALRDFLEQKKRIIAPEDIQRKIAQHFNIKISDLKSKKKNKSFILPRHTAMYLCRQLTDLSLPDIGRHFGGRDHSTVLHALHKMESALRNDPEFEQLMASLMRQVES